MLIAVVGATGTGKSELALDIAQALESGVYGSAIQAEIVNADAMQLYRGMDIGTAKLPLAERRDIPHHMLDVLDVTDEAAVADYQSQARTVIAEIKERGNAAVLVGGSGLYMSSVLYDFDFPGHDDDIRARLESELGSEGVGVLYRRLLAAAPELAARIDAQNARRVVRALEVLEISGENDELGTLPEPQRLSQPSTIVGLMEERSQLVERLDRRVEKMWRQGLVAEVESLIPAGIEQGVTAGRAIGYAQALAQLKGDMTELEAIEQAQLLTRRYARRQVSWFKRYSDVQWFNSGDAGIVEQLRLNLAK